MPRSMLRRAVSTARTVRTVVASPPPLRRTRWQGTTIGSGLAPSALPAARDPRGLPASVATCA